MFEDDPLLRDQLGTLIETATLALDRIAAACIHFCEASRADEILSPGAVSVTERNAARILSVLTFESREMSVKNIYFGVFHRDVTVEEIDAALALLLERGDVERAPEPHPPRPKYEPTFRRIVPHRLKDVVARILLVLDVEGWTLTQREIAKDIFEGRRSQEDVSEALEILVRRGHVELLVDPSGSESPLGAKRYRAARKEAQP